MSDFNLIVGADVGKSYEQFQKDISRVIADLNGLDLKVDISINMSSIINAASQIQQIIDNIRDNGGNLTINGFDAVAANIQNISEIITEVVRHITGFHIQLRDIFDAIPDGSAVSEKSFKKIEVSISSLVDQIIELNAVVDQISKKDFGNVINISDSSEDIRELELVREKALRTAEVFNQLKQTINSSFANSSKNPLGAGFTELTKSYPNLIKLIDSFDVSQIMSQISGGDSSEIARIISQYGNMNDVLINLINTINSSKGTNYPVPDVSKIQAAENAIREYKQAASDSPIDDGDGAKRTSATDYMHRLLELYGEVDKRFVDLRTQIENTFDLSTVKIDASPILKVIQDIELEFEKLGVNIESLYNMANNMNTQGSVSSTDMRYSLIRDSSSLISRMSRSKNKGLDESTTSEVTNLISKLRELQHQFETGSVSEQDFKNGLADVRLEFGKLTSTATSSNSPKMLTRDLVEWSNAIKSVEAGILKATDAKNKFTKAKHGKSKDDYADLDRYITKYKDLLSRLESQDISDVEFSRDIKYLNAELEASLRRIKSNGEATKTWSDKLGGLAKKFGQWFSVSQVIMKIVEYVKKMITTVIELDTAMTELRKVTDETDAAYEKFLVNATNRAKKLGSTVTDVVNASADFARLGYNLTESEQLADAAIIYKNVGDDIENINDASEKIIATMQAYGIETNNVMSIVDKFNEVSNEYAISTGGIGEALLRSAAAMESAGNTIDQTIALATAANTIVQNPETVGTTLKTVSMYLRAAKTDVEEAGESTDGMAGSVSELRKEILALTGNKVDIQIDEDNFKSTYQILQELSTIWSQLTDVSKANILEMVGGKRNANVVAALLENFDIASKSLETSMNSTGSALEENEKVIESIQGRINIMKASFETLANTLIEGDLLKGLVDMGTGILNIINNIATLINKIGGLKTVLASVVSILAVSKAETIFKIFEGDGKDKKGLIGSLQGVKTNIVALSKGAKDFTETFIFAKASGLTFTESLSAGLRGVGNAAVAAQLKMIALIVAIAAVAAVAIGIEKAVVSTAEAAEIATEKVKEFEDATNALSGAKEELDTINKRIKELQNIDSLTITEQAELDTLRLESAELESHVALLEAKAAAAERAAQAARDDVWREYISGSSIDKDSKKGVEARKEGLKSLNEQAEKYRKMAQQAYANNGQYIDETSRVFNAEDLEDNAEHFEQEAEKVKEELWGVVDVLETGNDKAKDAAYALAMYLSDPSERLKLLRAELDKLFGEDFTAENIINNYGKNGFERLTASIDELNKAGVIDLGENNIPDGEELDPLIEALQRTDAAATKTSKSLSSIKSYGSYLNTLSNGFKSLSDIYHDVKDENGFDFSSLFDSDFVEKFGGYTKEYEALVDTIANSPNDLNACQKAFNDLAAAYVAGEAKLEEVTDETKDLTIAMLEQNGVANAEAIVEKQLAINKAKLKANIELEKKAKEAGTDVTYEMIASLAAESEQSSITSEAILELALAKFNANHTTINSDDDIEHLIAIAKAAGVATESIAKLIQAQSLFDRAATMYATEGDSRSYQRIYGQAVRIANEAVADLNANDFKVKYDGITTGKDVELEAWNKLVAEKKHLLEMDKITEEEYYSWLASAYKKHISNTKEHRDEIIAIEEELYNWNKEKVQKNIDAELAVLDYERAKGLISEETYFAKRKELYANGYAELQNLVDEQGLYGIDSAERLKAETEFVEGVKEAHISSFEAERSALEHKLAMNIISEEQYLAELNRLYNEYYKDRAEYAEEAEEIEEELYDKRVELVKKWANAASDAIQEVADATENMVDALANFVEGAIDTNEENFNLEKSLLDHALSMNYISEEEYYSELEKLYQSYFKDKYAYMEQYWENQEEIYAHEQQMLEDSASAVEDIHSKVVEMIKKELEEAKETIEKTKEEYLDLINIRREALSELKDEDDYEKERNEKLSTISELQRQLNALSYDTSAAGVRKYKEVYAQLQEAQEELAEFEKERAYQIMNDQLDAEEEGIEKAFDAQTGKYDELLEDNVYLVEEAWKRMDGMSETLYQQLEAYNAKYSTSIKDDITDAWKTATAGLEGYKNALAGYRDINEQIGNSGMTQPEYDLYDRYVTEKQAANWVSTSVELGTSLMKTGADLVAGFADILAGLSDNPIFQLLSIGAGSMSSLAGAGAGIISSLTGLLGGLASGSDYVPRTGWYQTDEEGEELKLVKDSHGNQYRLLTEGSKVLNAGAVSRLMSLVNNPNLIAGLTKGASLGVSSGEIKANIDTSSRSVVLSPVFQITSNDPKGVANEIKKLLPTIADYALGTLVNGTSNLGIKRNAKQLC